MTNPCQNVIVASRHTCLILETENSMIYKPLDMAFKILPYQGTVDLKISGPCLGAVCKAVGLEFPHNPSSIVGETRSADSRCGLALRMASLGIVVLYGL